MLKYSKKKAGFMFAAVATCFAMSVVMLGAFTRLVDAGLGCPDWPVCYGHILWPMEEHEVAKANALFPDTPVEHDKTWPEQVHRLFASTLGLFCIALVVIAWRHRIRRSDTGYPFKLPLLLLGMVIVQGLFGMWTVTLKLWPQVVTAHLLGGFATISLLALLTARLGSYRWIVDKETLASLSSLKLPALVALLVVILQIALGGWTTSNYAALACPDLPLCQNSLWPVMDFMQGFNIFQDIGPNYLGGLMDSAARTAIHMSHRLGAIVVTVLVLIMVLKLTAIKNKETQFWARLLIAVLVLQLILGVSNVVFALPLYVAVFHNAVGAVLLIVLVLLNFYIRFPLSESGGGNNNSSIA